VIDFEEVQRRRDQILALTGDMAATDKQFIIECIAATMDLPDYFPPENPSVSIGELVVEAQRSVPVPDSIHLHGSFGQRDRQ
jgi:hypothetical protein